MRPYSEGIWIHRAIDCAKCGRRVDGRLMVDPDDGQTMDSEGFMDFDEPGPVCDTCIRARGKTHQIRAAEVA